MKNYLSPKGLLWFISSTLTLFVIEATAQNTGFDGVSWKSDNISYEKDSSGCGSISGLTFKLNGCSSGTQRQENKYARRTGIHAMVGSFRFSSPDFNGGIAVAQTHDDRTGSDGVFTIYRLHNENGKYYLMPQSDESYYDDFSWARVYADTDYYMDIQTWSDAGDSFERARLWRGTSSSGTLLKEWIIDDGSGDDDEMYKKIGAYQLTSSSGSITVTWKNVKFFTGQWNNSSSGGGGGSTVHMRKRNASGYAIDGGNGGANRQNVYLWSQNSSNVNQQWVEISRGNGYYSYQKQGTNYCIDGNNGGSNGQNVYLWTCSSSNQNQHWKKVSMGSGNYRLEKRNAPGYSLDGGNGGAKGQNLYLWKSSNSNQNQHWKF